MVSLVGPLGMLRRARRLRARMRVHIPSPAASFYVTTLHAATASPGQGLGGAPLDWAEAVGAALRVRRGWARRSCAVGIAACRHIFDGYQSHWQIWRRLRAFKGLRRGALPLQVG